MIPVDIPCPNTPVVRSIRAAKKPSEELPAGLFREPLSRTALKYGPPAAKVIVLA